MTQAVRHAAARARPSSLRGRVVLAVLALLAVLLTGLFITVDAILTSRLHADLRTRLIDRVALADQLDGALSPQQLVDRLRGDGVAALLCSPNSTSAATSGSTSDSTSSDSSSNRLRCVSADSGPPAPSRRNAGPEGAARSDAPQPRHSAAPQPPARVSNAAAPNPAPASVEQTGSVLYVRTVLPSTQQTLTLSVDDTQVGTTLHRLIILEVIGGLITLLVAALVLGRLVGTALRPLDHMTALARRISAGDRGRRLGNGRPDTELGRTATAFDTMLDDLESALAATAAAETRLRAFLNDVSHELRTPLTGLAATTETLLRDEPARADRERAYVTLVRETRRAGRLVDDLLTMTRLDTGMSLSIERVDLVEIAALEADRLRLLGPGLTIRLLADRPAPVRGDPVRLGQIIANLLENARTAAGPTGSIRLEVGANRSQSSAEWHLDVYDSGPGVAPADRERIFERLVRIDESRSRDRGGFGLGLAIARALARAHGGDLTCITPEGPGAGFRLTVPGAEHETTW